MLATDAKWVEIIWKKVYELSKECLRVSHAKPGIIRS